MASDQPAAAEVAEDFRASLVDLTNNDRYAINNFTVIARENTEYASEISDVLIEHIGKTKPDHKLPALYVLDSIAKNIGSPYTLFLAHKLYSTYMNAYSSVDRPTRRKLDEMLKTWRNPIPGSLDPRPVFPPEITGRIMNALHQSTTRAAQFEQQQQRNEQEMLRRRMAASNAAAATQWRETPTPPQTVPRYPPPEGYLNGQTTSPYPHNQFPPPIPQPQYPTAGLLQYPPPPSSITLESLHHDIEGLIRGAKEDLILNINNKDIQAKLKALLDLQQLLRSQQLPGSALSAVRDQLRALQMIEPSRPPILTQTVTPLPVPASIHQIPTLPPSIAPTSLQYAPPPPPIPVSIPPVPTPAPASSTNLAELLSSMQKSTQAPSQFVSTPQLSQSILAAAPPPLVVSENPLFAQLRAAGLLSSNTPALSMSIPPVQPPPQAPTGPVNLADLLKSVAPKISTTTAVPSRERIELTSASVKIPRPDLIAKLYETQSNQCTTCGKRFSATEEGKKEKATHLDWHFHTNQRLAESSQKGSSRSWYLEDEMEWIQFRAPADSLGEDSANEDADNSLLGPNSRKQDPKTRYVRVPSDTVLANSPCPICQERFEVSRSEEVQDFVWMDAVKVGGRIYHASCYVDMIKDGANTPARTATPDSVLGKRKAESSANPSPNKMIKENPD